MNRISFHFNPISRFFISIFFKTYREDWFNGCEKVSYEGGIYFDFFGRKILLGTYYYDIND